MIEGLNRYNFAATGRELHVDVPLSNVAMNYRPEGFIADMIFPVAGVPNMTGVVPGFDRGDLYRQNETRRAPGTQANRVTRGITSDNFVCINYALQTGVTIEDRANADAVYANGLFGDNVEFLVDQLSIDWEQRIATQITNTANVGSSSTIGSAWTDYTSGNSDPLGNLNTVIDNFTDANGVRPTDIVFGEYAFRHLQRHADIRNLILGTNNGGGYPKASQIGELIGIPNVHIGGAYRNTANEGQAETLSQIWNDNVIIYYRPPTPSVLKASFGYTLRWSAPGIPNMQVERHPYDSRTKTDDIEVGYYQDEKVTRASLGWLIRGVGSSQ